MPDKKNIRNILFLDVDGVLNIQSNSYTTAKYRDNLCEPHLVARLDYLCGKIENLEIVISSSWRYDMEALEEVLLDAGFKSWSRVIGRTPVSSQSSTLKRGEQIWEWVLENFGETFVQRHDANIFILDDEVRDITPFWSSGVYSIDCAVGLTDKTVNKIIASASTS